ncbi:hypothetical protein [Streptomyces goshikiensis]|uniref:hypothetical protein n=1 Tax=Streptomyces goshikiensis TaxID=1942 RepID=UPI0036BD9326
MIDDDLAVVPAADVFLRHVRFGRDQAELTTRTYAGHIALYLRWCIRTGRHWPVAAEELGLFVVWLKFGPKSVTGIERPTGTGLVHPGPGADPVREPARVRNVLTGVRQFLLHGITTKTVPSSVMAQLYEVAESWDLPEQARGEDLTGYRMRPRHRVQVPRKNGERATDREIVELFRRLRRRGHVRGGRRTGRLPVCGRGRRGTVRRSSFGRAGGGGTRP